MANPGWLFAPGDLPKSQRRAKIGKRRDVPVNWIHDGRLLDKLDEIEIIGPKPPGKRGTQVYRLYSWRGTLIYLGCSFNARKRLGEHSRGSGSPTMPWYPLVARMITENYPTREAALAAETAAINAELPLAQPHDTPVVDGDWIVTGWQRYWDRHWFEQHRKTSKIAWGE